MEPTYTIKEIMELQFKGIDHKLDNISGALRDQNAHFEKRFVQIEKELDFIKLEQEKAKIDGARYQVIWGMGAALGASLIAFTLNKIF